MSDADRARRYRARKKAGLRSLRINLDEDLIARGVRAGLVDIRVTEHDPDLEQAVEDTFRVRVEEEEKKLSSRVTVRSSTRPECSEMETSLRNAGNS